MYRDGIYQLHARFARLTCISRQYVRWQKPLPLPYGNTVILRTHHLVHLFTPRNALSSDREPTRRALRSSSLTNRPMSDTPPDLFSIPSWAALRTERPSPPYARKRTTLALRDKAPYAGSAKCAWQEYTQLSCPRPSDANTPSPSDGTAHAPNTEASPPVYDGSTVLPVSVRTCSLLPLPTWADPRCF
ncbi:hypothetical protein C8Q77DRAFT_353537 [Trametes polyzona]|nr:hypothetical protein C8Q77DRAFT_353537 [Trametes polyzona]